MAKEKNKQTESVQSEAHKNALAIAQKIEEIMGIDFFTIEQMRKKMVIPGGNNKQNSRALSWAEARGYIVSIMPYGLVEALPAVKDCYKIRLDYEYMSAYFEHQISIRSAEIAEFRDLIIIMKPSVPKEKATASEENKKTAKAVKVPKTAEKK